MEFGPCHDCGSSSPIYDLALAALLISGSLQALVALLAGFDWKEMAGDRELASGVSPRRRASLVAVVAVAAMGYHYLGKLWDATFFFPDPLTHVNGLSGQILAPTWIAALFLLAAAFFTLALHKPGRRQSPVHSPYADAADAATRPLQLPLL